MIDQLTAHNHHGSLLKKSSSVFLGYQTRYWRIEGNGTELTCYHTDPQSNENADKKIYLIKEIEVEEGNEQNKLKLRTPNKILELKAESEEDKNKWIKVLTYLKKSNRQSKSTDKKIPVLNKNISKFEKNSPLSEFQKRRTTKVKIVNAQTIKNEVLENDIKKFTQLGLQSYLKHFPQEFLKYHILSGEHRIKKNDTFSIFKEKYFILFSSKSLYPEKHISKLIMLNNQLPPWLEINCLYEIDFRKERKINLLHMKSIVDLEESTLEQTTNNNYTLKIHTGQKIFELAFDIYAMRNKWKILLERAIRNADEIEKNGIQIRRNIDLLIFEMQQQTLQNRLFKFYEEIRPPNHTCQQILIFLTKLEKELDEVIEAALRKKNNAIISFYFDYFHEKIFIEIKLCWDSQFESISLKDILNLAKWIDEYNIKYKVYVNDMRFILGVKTLMKVIGRKNWNALKELIMSIAETDKEDNYYEEENLVYTNSLIDIFKFLQDSFNINYEHCSIKQLIRILLQVYNKAFWLYLRTLKEIIDESDLSTKQLIGIINNSVEFIRMIREFIQANFIKHGIQEIEVNQTLETQKITKEFIIVAEICKDKIMAVVIQKITKWYHNRKYIMCQLDKIIEIINQNGEPIKHMHEITSRKFWNQILEHIVKDIIKSIIFSSEKKKEIYEITVNKLQTEVEQLKELFEPLIFKIHLKNNIDKLDKIIIALTSISLGSIVDALNHADLKPFLEEKSIRKIAQYRADLSTNQYKQLVQQLNSNLDRRNKDNDFRVSRRRKKTISLKVPGVTEQVEIEQDEEDYFETLEQEQQDEDQEKISNKKLKTISEGFLLKKQKNKKFWEKRYFRLKKGVLYWYPNKNSSTSQNFIKLQNIISIKLKNPEKLSFLITYKNQNQIIKEYKLKCQNIEEREKWLYSLQQEKKNLFIQEDKALIKPLHIEQKTTLFVDYDVLYQNQGYDLFKDEPKEIKAPRLMKKDSMNRGFKKEVNPQIYIQESNQTALNDPILQKNLEMQQKEQQQTRQSLISCLWRCFN